MLCSGFVFQDIGGWDAVYARVRLFRQSSPAAESSGVPSSSPSSTPVPVPDPPPQSPAPPKFPNTEKMATLAKWNRLYVRRDAGGILGDTVLIIQRMSKDKADGRWTAVFPDREVRVVDTRDRTLCTARRVNNVEFAEFPVMSRAQRLTAEDASRQILLDQAEALRRAKKADEDAGTSWFGDWDVDAIWVRWLRVGGWMKTGAIALFSTRAFGTMGLAGFVVWRATIFFEVFGCHRPR